MRLLMLNFYSDTDQHEQVIQFIPRRIDNSIDLLCAMDAFLALDLLQEAKSIAKKCANWLKTGDDTFSTGLVIRALADYQARVGNWESAGTLFSRLHRYPLMPEHSILGLVRLRLAMTLAAVNTGKNTLNRLKKAYDPEAELSVPDNDAARWKEIEVELARYQKEIEKIFPKEDQKDFGLGEGRKKC